MRKRLLIAAALLTGAFAAAAPVPATAAESPLNFGHCVADGVIDPQTDFVGPRTVVNGHVNHPQADEPPGQHWEYFWGCA